MTRSRVGGLLALVVALGVVAIVAAGCGGGSNASSPVTISNGQVDIQLPSSGPHDATGPSANTVPLARQNPTTALFTAITTFQSCLKGLGVTFIGAPDARNPNSPANDPTYINHLVTCAAKSNIIQALKAAQTAQDSLTPAQIAIENRAYLKWRVCMIGRGWGIPQPTPDSKGRLFSFGGASTGAVQFTPPPGQSLLSSTDIQQCAAKAEKQVPGSASLG